MQRTEIRSGLCVAAGFGPPARRFGSERPVWMQVGVGGEVRVGYWSGATKAAVRLRGELQGQRCSSHTWKLEGSQYNWVAVACDKGRARCLTRMDVCEGTNKW